MYQTKAYYDEITKHVDFSPFSRETGQSILEHIISIGDSYETELSLDLIMSAIYQRHVPVQFDWNDAERNAGFSNNGDDEGDN